MKTKWAQFKSATVVLASVGVLSATAYGMYCAIHSPLFTVRVVEVSDQPEDAPVDAQAISDLASVPIGGVNLFDLDLNPIEKRILGHPWIREVHIQKRFPQTVSISVVFREPQAIYQEENGNLGYIDEDGKVFGKVTVSKQADLPLISGLKDEAGKRLPEALKLVEAWSRLRLDSSSQIAQITYDSERGYRALVTYGASRAQKVTTMVDLGQDFDTGLDSQLERLNGVFRYLSDHSIAVRQVWADSGKKIVVKMARGS